MSGPDAVEGAFHGWWDGGGERSYCCVRCAAKDAYRAATERAAKIAEDHCRALHGCDDDIARAIRGEE